MKSKEISTDTGLARQLPAPPMPDVDLQEVNSFNDIFTDGEGEDYPAEQVTEEVTAEEAPPQEESTYSSIYPRWISTTIGTSAHYSDIRQPFAKVQVDSVVIDQSFKDFKYYDYVGDDYMFGRPVKSIDFWFAGL